MAQFELKYKIKAVEARQFELKNDLLLAKQEYNMEIQKNNQEIAKEISEIKENTTWYTYNNTTREQRKIPIRQLVSTLIDVLGYEVAEDEIKIIKKGAK